jgi:putative transposase
LVPGYPELRPFDRDFWTRFDRSVSYLRKNGLVVGFRIPDDETEER